MLSESAFSLLAAIRQKYGANVKGVGPASLKEIIELAESDEEQARADLKELEGFGFVGVDHALGGKIVGCRIMEAGQAFLDETLAD